MAVVLPPPVQQTSAANLLALLDEEDDALRLHALQSLNRVVHEFWFQIASSIASVEAFYEDEDFSHRELAALVASKVRSLVTEAGMLLFKGLEERATTGFLLPWRAGRGPVLCSWSWQPFRHQ